LKSCITSDCNAILPPLQVMDFLVFEVLCVCEGTREDRKCTECKAELSLLHLLVNKAQILP